MQETTTHTVLLKNERLASYNRISYIIFLINILSLFYVAMIANARQVKLYAIVGSGLALLWIVLNMLRYYSLTQKRMRFTPGYLFLFFVWFQIGFYSVAAALVLLAFLDYFSRRKMEVVIDAEAIRYPSLPPKIIAWDDVENMVMKDGLLTINLVNDKMLQAEVAEEWLHAEEEAFTAFAKECKEKAAIE
jgi:hypothetical protein